jgi:tRNA-dihydrouridine synthase A
MLDKKFNKINKILAVAPMMEWTDRHCRSFHRILSKHAHLYTEMINTGAIIYGDAHRHLDFDLSEHYVVLQLGGSDPLDLAKAALKAQEWGYDQIDLNCGCPSERVQKGAFGACLMAEPDLVADCVKAMKDVVSIPISVKHRLGLNEMDLDLKKDYQFTLDFMSKVSEAGASQLTIHARNAILKGLSPKENRTIPTLRYDIAKQLRIDLKKQFPDVHVLLNGGLDTNQAIVNHWNDFDGFMMGRSAYHMPAQLLAWDLMIQTNGEQFGYFLNEQVWHQVNQQLVQYIQKWFDEVESQKEGSFYLAAITRHILGFAHGLSGSRYWRQYLSDHRILEKVRSKEAIANFFESATSKLRMFSNSDDVTSLGFLDD